MSSVLYDLPGRRAIIRNRIIGVITGESPTWISPIGSKPWRI